MNVLLVRGSKLSINDLMVQWDHWKFPSENDTLFRRIL